MYVVKRVYEVELVVVTPDKWAVMEMEPERFIEEAQRQLEVTNDVTGLRLWRDLKFRKELRQEVEEVDDEA